MKKYEIEIDLSEFPVELHEFLNSGRTFDSSCSPEARTLYCNAGFYIKTAHKGTLAREAQMGKLFHQLGMGVDVMAYISADRDYLVTRSAAGEDLTYFLEEPKTICRILADGLQKLHSQSAAGFPISAKLADYDNLSGFNDYLCMDYIGIHSREEALAVIGANQGRLNTDTLIHGDACLPNAIACDREFGGFVDCGLAGAGDRHIDLFWAIWSLQFNLKTEHYTDYFLDRYGRENVDLAMLRSVAAFELLGGE